MDQVVRNRVPRAPLLPALRFATYRSPWLRVRFCPLTVRDEPMGANRERRRSSWRCAPVFVYSVPLCPLEDDLSRAVQVHRLRCDIHHLSDRMIVVTPGSDTEDACT